MRIDYIQKLAHITTHYNLTHYFLAFQFGSTWSTFNSILVVALTQAPLEATPLSAPTS